LRYTPQRTFIRTKAQWSSALDNNKSLEVLREKDGFLIDMDGVLYHKNELLPGAQQVCVLV
jgi:hypothetical protein